MLRFKTAITLVLSAVLGAAPFVSTAVATGAIPAREEVLTLTAADASAEDFFGWAVAISGELILVGALQDDRPLPNGRRDGNIGSTYGFNANTGQQLFKLNSEDAQQGDRFGAAVAVDGGLAIIGAPGDHEAGINVGSAYLFDVNSGQQLFKLAAPDANQFHHFGDAVDIHGQVAIVGASGDDDGAPGAGAAYLFDAATGSQLFKLTASDPADSDGL